MHLTIMLIIAITALIFVGAMFWGYPKTVLQAEYRKVLLFLPMIFMYFGIAFWIIVQGFHRPLREAPDISVSILWAIFFVLSIIHRLQSWQQAGKVLLDIRPIPNRFAYVALAIIFMLIGFVSDFFYFIGAPNARYASLLLGASFAIYVLVMAGSRLQIREKGFWVYGHLLKWEKIETLLFHRDEHIHVLKLVYKAHVPTLLRTFAFAVPSKKKGVLNTLLQHHLPSLMLAEKSA